MDLMRARHRLSKLLLRHGIRFDDGPRLDPAPPRLAGHDRCPVARRASDDCSTPKARSTRSCTAATRSNARSPRYCPRPRGRRRRPAALPARHRHPDRRRPVLRDRQLANASPTPSNSIRQLPRAPCPASTPPAARAARARSPRPAPAAPAACSSRPPGTTAPAPAPPRKALSDRQAGQPAEAIAIAWSARRRLHRTWTPARTTRETPHRHRRRRRPRTWAGFCWAITPASNNPHPPTTRSRRLGRWRPGNTREPASRL